MNNPTVCPNTFYRLLESGVIGYDLEKKNNEFGDLSKIIETNFDSVFLNRLRGMYSEIVFSQDYLNHSINEGTLLEGGWFIPPKAEKNPFHEGGAYITVVPSTEGGHYEELYARISENYRGTLFALVPIDLHEDITPQTLKKSFKETFATYFFDKTLKRFSKVEPSHLFDLFTSQRTAFSKEKPNDRIKALCREYVQLFSIAGTTGRLQFFHRMVIDHFFRQGVGRGRISDIDTIILTPDEVTLIDIKLKFPTSGENSGFGGNKDHMPFFRDLIDWDGFRILYVVNKYADEGHETIMDSVPRLFPKNWRKANMKKFFVSGRSQSNGSPGANIAKTQQVTILKLKYFYPAFLT